MACALNIQIIYAYHNIEVKYNESIVSFTPHAANINDV